jgi:hypothetical protein
MMCTVMVVACFTVSELLYVEDVHTARHLIAISKSNSCLFHALEGQHDVHLAEQTLLFLSVMH